MSQFVQLTVNGLTIAAIYSLIALGFSLIYNVSRVLNLAQGSFYTLSAFVAYMFLVNQFNMLASFLLSIVIVMVIGLIFERWIIRPSSAGGTLSVLLLLTLGVSMVLEGLMKIIWGTDPVALPSISKGVAVQYFGVNILVQNLLIIGSVIAILLMLNAFFKYTYLGKSMTAVAENPVAAGIMGINANLVRSIAFAISAIIGAIGGILAAPITLVSYNSATMIGLKGFIAAVVGGLGNVFGGVIGGIILALAESYSAVYISSLFQDTTAFLILIFVLIARSLKQKGSTHTLTTIKSNAPVTVEFSKSGKVMGMLALALLIVFPFITSNAYLLGIAIIIFIYMLAALGLELLHGFTGILSLGQAGFMAIAGYTFAILIRDVGINPIAALFIAVAVSFLVAWFLAISTIRLTGYNIAIATLGFTIIIESLAVGLRNLTGGSSGFTGIPSFNIGTFTLDSERSKYYITLFFLILGFIAAYNITRSKLGRVLKSINQDPLAASSMGINVSKYKIRIFIIASIYASIAGILYANYMNFISPSMVGMDASILLLIMIIFGGSGSLWGVIPGVIILRLIPEMFSGIANYQIIFEGLILILTLILFKGGIWGLTLKIWENLFKFMNKSEKYEIPKNTKRVS